MRLNVQCLHLTGMLADCMVIPLSRSAGKKSVVVLPVSTDPEEDRYEDLRRIDSVKVVFPESGVLAKLVYGLQKKWFEYLPMCATTARLRTFEGS